MVITRHGSLSRSHTYDQLPTVADCNLPPRCSGSLGFKKKLIHPRPEREPELSEPEPSSEPTISDDDLPLSWSSSPVKPPPSSLSSPKAKKIRHIDICTPFKSKEVDIKCPLDPCIASPVRKRLRTIENLPSPTKSSSKYQAQLQTVGKTLSSLCDKWVVQETPVQKRFDAQSNSSGFSNVFAHARYLLKLGSTQGFAHEAVVGRSKELTKIQDFFAGRFPWLFGIQRDKQPSSSAPSSLYISGPPGTGKTHLVNSLLLNPNHHECRTLREAGIRVRFINCFSLVGAGGGPGSGIRADVLDDELWKKLSESLGVTSDPCLTKAKGLTHAQRVEKYILDGKCAPSIVVLDEIDVLAVSKLPLITSLLSLSHRAPSASFTIVGIANALDLVARLKPVPSPSTPEAYQEPDLVHFSPFESSDMIAIVKQRLECLCPSYHHSVPRPNSDSSPALKLFADSPHDALMTPVKDGNSIPLFHPAALQLCAKKISSINGDLRTFFSILRKCLETAELNMIRGSEFLQNCSDGHKSVLDTPTKMRKFTRIISSSQLAPDLGGASASENDWLKSRIGDPCSHLTPLTAPKVSPGDVVKCLKTSGILEHLCLNTSEAECSKKLQDLNLHQSIVLVCLCVGWSREQDENGSASCSVAKGRAYEVYRDCLYPQDGKHANSFNIGIAPVSENEWSDLVESGLQTRGLVTLTNHNSCGMSSCSTTPTTSRTSSQAKATTTSPLKSPGKRKPGAFQRPVLCTPTKSKSSLFSHSPRSTKTSSPHQSKANYNQDSIIPTHPISVLIKCIQSLAQSTADKEHVQDGSDDKPRFSPEIISLLNQLLASEEKRMKNHRKRKACEISNSNLFGNPAGPGQAFRECHNENDEDAVLNERLVTKLEEGSCQD